jgi:hypothetical protein
VRKPIHAVVLLSLVGGSILAAVGAGCSSSSTSSGSGALQTCQNPPATQVACDTCTLKSCNSAALGVQSQCPDFLTCIQACDCSDTTCTTQCSEAVTEACQDAMNAYACPACATDCGSDFDAGSFDASTTGISLFTGSLPAGLPTTCTDGVYDLVAGGIAGLCDGGDVYLLCFLSAWADYECSVPVGFTAFGGGGDGGSDASSDGQTLEASSP